LSRIRTLSLFSGAGGLDLGFLAAGFDIVGCVEIEPNYCKTLRANVGGNHRFGEATTIHEIDIRKFDTAPYKNSGIQCVIGGPPCQTFSAAGRRSGGVIGTEDERGQLFQAYCRVLDELQPEVFVFENVYGLPGANKGEPWREICAAFSERGYRLNWVVVDAADYGVPQHRERLIMIGSRSKCFAFPIPTHGPDSNGGSELVSVAQAINDLQSDDEPFHDKLGGMYGHLLPLVPEGLNYAYFTAEMNHPAPVFAWRSKFHDLLYKVDRNSPCRTLKAQPGKFTGPFHWKNRHFTTAELKRLQSFPDDYELQGSNAVILEQIGNSVPPRLAEVIAVCVKEQLFQSSEKLTYPVRQEGFKSTFRQRQRARSAEFRDTAKEAHGSIKPSNAEKTNSALTTYWVTHQRLFERTEHQSSIDLDGQALQVSVSEYGPNINLEIVRLNGPKLPLSTLEISGLRKYLPDYEQLSVKARILSLDELFQVWSVVEKVFVARSRFFTLIDIYGHYANRGDTVKIVSDWKLGIAPEISRMINFFGKTENCGQFIKIENLKQNLNFQQLSFPDVIDELRRIRVDVRTTQTHPIIQAETVLCTYPFPLLSPRALVESKVRMLRRNAENADLAEAV
jgi:DNA (cytosine-5)-methyltransferase 1